MAEVGWRPGWDFAGVVEQPAADGTGPRKGTRVVGMLDAAAWAEVVAAPTSMLAALPENVSLRTSSGSSGNWLARRRGGRLNQL